MPRIRCHYTDCVFVDDGYCSAAAVEIDPDTGCATFTPVDDATKEEDWDEEEQEEWEETDGEDEDEPWADDDEDEV